MEKYYKLLWRLKAETDGASEITADQEKKRDTLSEVEKHLGPVTTHLNRAMSGHFYVPFCQEVSALQALWNYSQYKIYCLLC